MENETPDMDFKFTKKHLNGTIAAECMATYQEDTRHANAGCAQMPKNSSWRTGRS